MLAAGAIRPIHGSSSMMDPDQVLADTTPFDMRGAEFSHRDGGCSFETFLRRYELEDAALSAIARIVHEADLEDDRYVAPEAPGLDVLVRGLDGSRRSRGARAERAAV